MAGLYKTEGIVTRVSIDHYVKPKLINKHKQNYTNSKTMTYIRGRHALVMLISLVFFVVGSAAAAGEDIPLFELSSRDEVVQMAGYGHEKLSTVLITGSVNCEAPFPSAEDQTHAWPIPGASVAVNCHSHASQRKGKSAVVARGATDEFGDFMVDLPSHLHAIPNLEKICTVKVHRIPKGSLCRPAGHVKRLKQLRLSSFGNGIRTYTAGNIRLQHSTSDSEGGN